MKICAVIPVFRDAANALALIKALQGQILPARTELEIVVVDDGSGDGTAEALQACASDTVRLIALPQNVGRAKARNAGAAAALGDMLVFIDCDCRPTSDDFLAAHWWLLNRGYIATCGRVTGDGNGFWSRYQADASARRERQHARGAVCSGSTQNFAVDKAAFRRIGGFDTRYREYGFEDRDLFARLARSGAVGWCHDAQVRHLDALTLPGVLEKMKRAAGESAILFMQDHAQAYRALGYSAIDVRLHGWLRLPCIAFKPMLRLAPVVDALLRKNYLPYGVAKRIVKLLTALAYAVGSMQSGHSDAGT